MFTYSLPTSVCNNCDNYTCGQAKKAWWEWVYPGYQVSQDREGYPGSTGHPDRKARRDPGARTASDRKGREESQAWATRDLRERREGRGKGCRVLRVIQVRVQVTGDSGLGLPGPESVIQVCVQVTGGSGLGHPGPDSQ